MVQLWSMQPLVRLANRAIVISVNDLVHSCRNCKFVRPHFECFVPDMEWLVDITETNEEGMFFLVVIGYFCKVISQAAQARDEGK